MILSGINGRGNQRHVRRLEGKVPVVIDVSWAPIVSSEVDGIDLPC